MEKGIKELFTDLGIVTKRNNGSDKVVCPKCSHTRKKKNDPCLSIDLESGTYNCHNPGCDFRGKVANVFVPKPKEYIKPVYINNTILMDATVQYFFKRGISQQTLQEARVTEGLAYMPQFQQDINTIQFNYFRDGEIVNIKYRGKSKSFKMVKDAELIFYGLDDVKESEWCVIVEGEIDKLSFTEAGVKEVISVPNGASKGNSNLQYLDNCIDYFKNKKRIILATDNDEPGMVLRNELARRLGYERCYKVDFGTCKDANEYLVTYGAKMLAERVELRYTIEFPISGIITGNMIWDDVENFLENGLDRGATTGILKEFDEMVSFMPGQLMALTGIPNHGKSPFALLVMCGLSINHGWKWGLFTPEHKPLALFLIKLCEMLMGKRVRKGVKFQANEKELVKSFVNEHFYFIEPEDGDISLDNILDKATKLVVRYGIRGFLMDPWNKIEHNIERGESETSYISRQLDNVIRFDQKYGVFSIIIAHPVKIKKQFKSELYEIPTLYDISGSSNWFNKVDMGITFYRNYKTGFNEIHVQKMKYDHLGRQGSCNTRYNMNSGRFTNENGDWDNSNWLITPPTQLEIKDERDLSPEASIARIEDNAESNRIQSSIIKIDFDKKEDEEDLPW